MAIYLKHWPPKVDKFSKCWPKPSVFLPSSSGVHGHQCCFHSRISTSTSNMADLDLVNRDPNSINEHIRVSLLNSNLGLHILIIIIVRPIDKWVVWASDTIRIFSCVFFLTKRLIKSCSLFSLLNAEGENGLKSSQTLLGYKSAF